MSKKSENAPPRVNLRGYQMYLGVAEVPKAQNRKLVATIGVLAGLALAQGVTLMMLVPLKERVPYMVEVETSTGAVRASDTAAQRFTPDEKSVRYHLAKWAENLLTVDEHSRGMRLPQSYTLMRGAARDQWQAFVEREKPLDLLIEDPQYRRQARIVSVALLSKETALIRAELSDTKRAIRMVQITLSFAMIPPSTDEEVFRNPIGLWITNFGVQDELLD